MAAITPRAAVRGADEDRAARLLDRRVDVGEQLHAVPHGDPHRLGEGVVVATARHLEQPRCRRVEYLATTRTRSRDQIFLARHVRHGQPPRTPSWLFPSSGIDTYRRRERHRDRLRWGEASRQSTRSSAYSCEAISPMSGATEFVALVAAGVLAGTVGAAGGVTSLVSYPALLAVGVPPLPANVVNLVAAVACWPGSALTSRRELAGAQGSLRRGLPIAAAGSAVGALLLLNTSPGAFTRIVPFLVAAGSLALLVQPWLSTVIARKGENRRAAVWPRHRVGIHLRGLLRCRLRHHAARRTAGPARAAASGGQRNQEHAAWCWGCRCCSHLCASRASGLVRCGAAWPLGCLWAVRLVRSSPGASLGASCVGSLACSASLSQSRYGCARPSSDPDRPEVVLFL